MVAGWMHLAIFGAFIPVMAILQLRRATAADRPLPNRMAHFQSTVLSCVFLAGFSLLVARTQRIDLGLGSWPSLTAWGAGVLVYAIAVGYMRPKWRRAVETRERVVHLYMASNAVERVWWVIVSIAAGAGEEISWRGVQFALLNALLGGSLAPLAGFLCAVQFAVAHGIQGWRSVLIIFCFAVAFQGLVWIAGSLYVAIAFHIAYDVTAGITYGKLGRELGYEQAA